MAGLIEGGYLGAHCVSKVNAKTVRGIIVTIGVLMPVVFFQRLQRLVRGWRIGYGVDMITVTEPPPCPR